MSFKCTWNHTSLVVLWSESLTTNHEVPGSIPGSTVGIFLEGVNSRRDHGLGRLVEFKFEAPPGTTSSSFTIHTPSGQCSRASWASQPQKSVTPSCHAQERGPRSLQRTCGDIGGGGGRISKSRCVGNTDITYTANNTVELSYNVMKGTACFVLLQKSVVITEECNVTVDIEASINGCHRISDIVNEVRINRCRCNWLRLYLTEFFLTTYLASIML